MNGKYIAEQYQIESPISHSGGMASVYLAHLVDDKRLKVAIKFARTGANGPAHEDVFLQREADLLSRSGWRHPGIVHLYPTILENEAKYCLRAVNIEDRPWYMVMEYLSGESLAQNIKRIQRYSVDWKLEMFYQVLIAVSFIHQKGYAHRDLKPDNIVFRLPIVANQIPQPILVDFALTSDGKSGSEIVETSYTLEYASPERIAHGVMNRTNDYDDPRASDIWSLGVLLFELLTGKLPIKGHKERVRTTLISRGLDDIFVGNDYLKDMQESDQKLSDLIGKIIRVMLERKPSNRPDIETLINVFEKYFCPPRIPFTIK